MANVFSNFFTIVTEILKIQQIKKADAIPILKKLIS
jgi:hypothetical protein